MVDLILLVIILIAAVYGFRLGLMKSLIGLLGNILALFLGYILAKPTAEYIQLQFQTIDILAEHIKNILPMPQDFSEMVASMDGLGKLYSYLENSPLPKGLQENILQTVAFAERYRFFIKHYETAVSCGFSFCFKIMK